MRPAIRRALRGAMVPGTGSRFDPDAAAFFALSAAITDRDAINRLVVGAKGLFDWSQTAIYLTRSGQNGGTATVLKLGGATWASNGTLRGTPTPTLGASGTALASASSQYLELGSWGASFAGGIYAGTAHSANSVAANTRGLSIEDDDGSPLGGMWAPFGTGAMFWDCLGSGSGRVTGAAGATSGTMHLWAGTSLGKCWRDTTQAASGGGTDSLGLTFDRVQVGRSATSIASNLTLACTWAVADGAVDTAKHNSWYALLKATVLPGLAALGLAAIYNAYVYPHGNGIEFALTKPLHSLTTDGFTVTADGNAIPIERVVPSGSAGGVYWELQFKNHWITAGQEVVISYDGDQFAPTAGFTCSEANQDSLTTQRAIDTWSQRTGMSIHFNTATYTIAGGLSGQLAPGNSNVNLFNPTGLTGPDSLDNWIQVAQSIDSRMLMLTTKHVDGYCLWDSTVSADRCITASEPWWTNQGFDIVDAFCTKTRAAGMKVGFYFSVLDRKFRLDHPEWAWADYQSNPSAAATYTAYIQDQLTELLDGRYGVIDEILLDAWDITGNEEYPSYTAVNKASTLALIRSLQPGITILINDYKQSNVDTEIAISESGTAQPVPRDVNRNVARHWSTPTNDNNGWFDDPDRRDNYAAVSVHVDNVALTRARQGDLLWNISPDVTGLFDAFQIAYCEAIGAAIET